MNTDKRDKILMGIALPLIACGLIGLHYDWMGIVLLIPFSWLLLGIPLAYVVNGKNPSGKSVIVSVAIALLLMNVAMIIFHRDTAFIVGRLLCIIGISILVIRTTEEAANQNK